MERETFRSPALYLFCLGLAQGAKSTAAPEGSPRGSRLFFVPESHLSANPTLFPCLGGPAAFACRGQFNPSLRLSAVLAHTMRFCATAGSIRSFPRESYIHSPVTMSVSSQSLGREALTGQSAETNCP